MYLFQLYFLYFHSLGVYGQGTYYNLEAPFKKRGPQILPPTHSPPKKTMKCNKNRCFLTRPLLKINNAPPCRSNLNHSVFLCRRRRPCKKMFPPPTLAPAILSAPVSDCSYPALTSSKMAALGIIFQPYSLYFHHTGIKSIKLKTSLKCLCKLYNRQHTALFT